MTLPTGSVQIRRVAYMNWTQIVTATGTYLPEVKYDDTMTPAETNVLDTVLEYNSQFVINGYHWDGTRQVPN